MVVAPPVQAAYDLAEAFERARSGDSQVASAASQRDAAQQRVRDARLAWAPQVDLAVGRSNNRSNLSGVPGVDSGRMSFSTTTLTLTATQPLYNRGHALYRAEGELQSAYEEIQVRQSANDLMLRLVQAHLDLILAQAQLRSLARERQLLDTLAALAAAQPEAADAASLRPRLAQAALDERLAHSQLLQRQLALRQVMGAPVSALPEFDLGQPPLGERDLPDLETLQAQARSDNLTVLLQQKMLQIADTALERSRAARLPSVDAVANYAAAQGLPLYSGARTSALVVGITANIPLSAGLVDAGRIKESSFLRNKAAHDLETARRMAVQSGLDAHFEWQANLLQIEAEARRLQALEEAAGAAAGARAAGPGAADGTAPAALTAAAPAEAAARLEAQLAVQPARRELQRLRHENLMLYLRVHHAAGTLAPAQLRVLNRYLR